MEERRDKKGISRREFMKAAGVTAAGFMAGSLFGDKAMAADNNAPAAASVLGANDRINVGFIGVGGMGGGHLNSLKNQEGTANIKCVAVCDVFSKRKEWAKNKAGVTDADAYTDYRKLLERKDIDAVVIATPDHWHGPIAVAAMEAGKHVYIEKPMTHTLEEAFQVHDTAKKTGKIVQVGSQGCTDATWATTGKLVRDGRIGPVLWAQGSYCRNNPQGEWNYPIDPDLSVDTCDWDMWLGSAPKVEFSPEHYHRWRKYWAYGTGIIGDLWPHRLHPLMIAMDKMEFPRRVSCLGGNICNTDEGVAPPRDVADTTLMIAEFADGSMIYLAGATTHAYGYEDCVRGQKARLNFSNRKVQIMPERPFVDEIDPEEVPVEGHGEDVGQHERNWLESIRGNETPNCGIDLATRVQVIVSLAEKSYRESIMPVFDAEKRQIINV